MVRGVVTFNDEPMKGAFVMEINKDHRILHQTTTDENGVYVLPVSKVTNSVRVLCPGFYTLTHKVHENMAMNFRLQEKPKAADMGNIHNKGVETNKLLCGHVGDSSRPQICRFEQVSDTLFSLIIPLQVKSLIDEYSIGRKMIFLDILDNQLLTVINGMDAQPIVGEPNNIERIIHVQAIGEDYQPGQVVVTDNPSAAREDGIYVYPRFQFTINQLMDLLGNGADVKRIAIDTPHADNYGILYPTSRFKDELRRVIGKLISD